MKRSQIDVKRRISELLCVKSTFFFPGPVSNFRLKPGIYPGMAETGPVWLVLKPVRNNIVSVPVYAPVQNIPAIPVGMV